MFRKLRVIIGKLKPGNMTTVFSRPVAKWQTQKRSKKIVISASFVVVLAAGIFGLNYLNNAGATWNNLITWSSQADFNTNTTTTGSNGATPAATTNTFADTTTSSGDVKLIKPSVTGSTMAGGYYDSFVVKNDGTLWVTGEGRYSQLGLGDVSSTDSFTQVTALGNNVASVSSNYQNSFVIKKDGTLWGAGNNATKELGITGAKTSWTDTGQTNVKQVSAGYSHSVLLKTDGTAWTTGYNGYGQFGNAGTTNQTVWTQVTNVNVSSNIAYVAAGANTVFLVKTDGTVWGAGQNTTAQLGTGDLLNKTTWVQLSGLSGITKLVSYNNNSFALKNDGTLWAAGVNNNGALGLGNTAATSTWTQTASGVLDIATGVNHSILVKTDGTVWAAGQGSQAALGTGNNIQRSSWIQTDVTGAVEAAAGGYHSMVRKTDGSIKVVGNNQYGQLGAGDAIYRNTWQSVDTGAYTSYSAGKVASGQYFSLVVKSDGTLWGVGNNIYGQLGLGDTVNRFTLTKTTLTNVAKVVAGDSHALALKSDGTLWATGYNNAYQLGNGNTNSLSTWTQVLTGVSDVATNNSNTGNFTIVVKTDGTVWSVGTNTSGTLGDGTAVTKSAWTQAKINASTFLTGASKVSVGYSHSLVVAINGDLYGTGIATSGQLGLGSGDLVGKMYFTKSSVVSGASRVWAGQGLYSYMQKTDGTIWGVGNGNNGRFGAGNSTSSTDWVAISGFTNALDVYPGTGTVMILKSDGTLHVTGTSYFGETGSGLTYEARNTFGQVASGVAGAAVGQYQSIMYKTDGTVQTTGWNINGALGIPIVNDGFRWNFVDSQTNVKRSHAYYDTGTISGYKINAGDGNVYKWNSISWVGVTPSNTSIKFRVRGAATEVGLASAAWSSYYTSSGSSLLGTQPSQWLEVELTLNTSDGINTPTLNDFTINYYTDTTAPTNPTTASAYTNPEFTSQITSEFANVAQPSFRFSGAGDEVNGSGVTGYYVYLGASSDADPLTAGVYQAGGIDPQIFTPASPLATQGSYYLIVKTVDGAGNISNKTTLFTYRFDNTTPTSPSFINVTPFGWSPTNNFSFTWNAGNDDSGSNGTRSGLTGYQYKVGGTVDDWVATEVMPVISTQNLSAANLTAPVDGQNTFYIRSIDNAGNMGEVKQVYFYYNGSAPSAPQVPVDTLNYPSVSPQSSDVNSFTFQWDLPATYNGSIKGYRYSINAVPNATNTIALTIGSLPDGVTYDAVNGRMRLSGASPATGIPAATLQGINKLYVVAVDSNDLVAYGQDNTLEIGFSCETTAPGAPTNVELFDTSNRATAEYSVAVKWSEPANKGVGFAGYNIYRSVDPDNFSDQPIGSSTGNSFIDTDSLISQLYYYKVKSRDNSSNVSIDSEIKSIVPTGKYTEPPIITVEPELSVKVSTASVRWVTDRGGSSFVELGEDAISQVCSENYGFTQGQMDFETDHRVSLGGLKPDTIYHYRVKFVDQDGNIGCSADATFHTQPAPRVERVSVQDVRLYTAILTWYTSEPATSDLLYGKSSNYANTLTNVSGGATTVHSVRLDNLEHSSTYHFAIRITDSDGNQIMSDDYSFDTQQYPRLSNVRFQPMADQSTATFKVTWDSNVPTTSVVEFQPEGGKAQEAVKTKLETKHEIIVSGLFDNTYYLIKAIGVDQYGNQVVSDTNRVKTDFDTRPPVLIGASIEVSNNDFGATAQSQMVVSWETDEPSTSQVEYGLGVTGDNYDIRSQEDATLTTSHVVVVSGLRPSSAYHVRAVSSDQSNNKGYSEQQSILTEQARSSVLDIIIGSLQSSLGWLFGMQ